jgi:hypothetical protein
LIGSSGPANLGVLAPMPGASQLEGTADANHLVDPDRGARRCARGDTL